MTDGWGMATRGGEVGWQSSLAPRPAQLASREGERPGAAGGHRTKATLVLLYLVHGLPQPSPRPRQATRHESAGGAPMAPPRYLTSRVAGATAVRFRGPTVVFGAEDRQALAEELAALA